MSNKTIRRRDGITPDDDARANAIIDSMALQLQLFGAPVETIAPMPLAILPVAAAPTTAPGIRYAKIIEEARAGYRRARHDGARIQTGTTSFVPFIRIRGRWLERAGFAADDTISIEVSAPGTLIIRKAEA